MERLAPGFLIAMPQLGDPNFQRSVVLMIEHSAKGSMGLVVNRASPLTLAEVADGQKLDLSIGRRTDAVYLGGPVEPYRGFVLHDDAEVEERVSVLPGLYLSVTNDALKPLLASGDTRLRFCLGYAGWGPSQVEKELEEGSWLFTEANAQAILELPAEELWAQTLKGMGVDPAMLMISKGLN
ncbi:MAG: YqgE/AlgH family protein [Myxococcaceae bacterium]|nr:YqgE/AlgH family protein [Myxococcaceae bacterium]